jgi:hypothetical protein
MRTGVAPLTGVALLAWVAALDVPLSVGTPDSLKLAKRAGWRLLLLVSALFVAICAYIYFDKIKN